MFLGWAVMQGVAMLLQNRYQRQRLYTRIALGKVLLFPTFCLRIRDQTLDCAVFVEHEPIPDLKIMHTFWPFFTL